MKKVFLSVSIVILLSGCAHVASPVPPATKSRHHVAPVVIAPVVAPAPIIAPPVVVAPVAPPAKKTFKQRWLSKFFRDRATAK